MVRHRTNTRAAALVAVVFLFLSFHSVDATIVDFNGLPAGTVVAGQDPSEFSIQTYRPARTPISVLPTRTSAARGLVGAVGRAARAKTAGLSAIS
jgi:hypothetical protein